MLISLISTLESPEATGLRSISSFLKAHGHTVRMIFLSAKRTSKSTTSYPAELREQVLDRVRDSDLIGLGMMTGSYCLARDLTEAIHQSGIKAPVIWGGVHPTVSPESCIETADMVCVGEGEWPMLDLAEAMKHDRDDSQIPNLWVRRNGHVIRNEVRPLFEDLDKLPVPDYDIEQDHYVIHKGELAPASPGNLRGILTRYRIMTTRGCPYQCSFCCNNRWLSLYRGKGQWVRIRSVDNVIGELEDIKTRYPGLKAVAVMDDTFFLRSEDDLEAFSRRYRERIGLPFDAYTHPAMLTERKLQTVTECGCTMVKMGIQSGSSHTSFDVFNRRVPLEKVANSIDLLERFKNLRKEYHYIGCNPYESDEERRETLHYVAEHHRGDARIVVFPLAFFPGTELHRRAREDGILTEEQADIYERSYTSGAKRRFDWLGYHIMLFKVVTTLRRYYVPRPVVHRFIDVMLSRPVRYCLDRKSVLLSMSGLYLVGRTIRKMLYQTFIRPFRRKRKIAPIPVG